MNELKSPSDSLFMRRPALVGAVGVLWILFLVFQEAYVDETEHLHVAWLIGKLGLAPMHDFFQHHMPLLWELLSPYYRWGGSGAEGLFYGRALVVACALAMTVGVYRFAIERAADRSNAEYAFALAMVSLALFSVTFVPLVTVRPETLSAAFACLSLACWTAGTGREAASRAATYRISLDALAGILFGVALHSSPRFVLMGGMFFLFGARPDRIIEFPARRLAVLAAGTVGGFALLTWALGYSVEYLKFAVLFSAHLQKVGDPGLLEGQFGQGHLRMPWLLLPVAQVAYVYVAFYLFLAPAQRGRMFWHLAYVGAVIGFSLLTGWPHYYVQNLYPAFLAIVLQIAYFAGSLDWRNMPLGRAYLGAGAVLCGVAMFWSLLVAVAAGETLADGVLFRRQLQRLVQENEAVLMSYESHPIAVRDASWYGPGLVDSQDRMCQAAATWTGSPKLPPCDYYEDLVARNPVMIDFRLRTMLPQDKRNAGQAIMSQRYEPAVTRTIGGKMRLRGVYVQPAIIERARTRPGTSRQ